MLLFTIWGIASCFWSIDPTASMERLPTYILLFLSYFLIVNIVGSEKQLSTVMVALWLGTLVLLTSGVLEMTGIWKSAESDRLSGVIGNANAYVVMLVAYIPACYWVFTRTVIPLRKLVTGAALVAAGITSLHAQSRGGVVSISVFFLVLLAYRQTRWRGLALAVLLLVLALRAAPLGFWERWEEVRVRGGDVRTLELWPVGLRTLAQSPLTGSGLGTNAQAIAPALRRTATGLVVHNPLLGVAIELGLPGLLLYLGFTVYPLVLLLRALKSSVRLGRPKESAFAIVLVASFAGYMASWFKGGGMECNKMLWVLLGLMSAYARILEQPPDVEGAQPPYTVP
jgi:hypothetical protein